MKLTRQQILLGFLAVMGIFQAGNYVLNSMIQGPLDKLRNEQASLEKDIAKREKLLADGRVAGKKIELWQKKSLPADLETARSLYRNWSLNVIRQAKLQNATVDSGSPSTRYGLYRAMPFDVKARGTLAQLTTALFQFTSSDQLHEIKSLRLTPIAATGQFDITLRIEALMIPGTKRKTLNTGKANVLASSSVSDYSIIAKDNFFGIGISQLDPMKMTTLSAITVRNDEPVAWFTEQITGRVIKAGPNATFETDALSGRIVQIDDDSATIETSGQQLRIAIGKSFAEGVVVPLKQTPVTK